MPQGGLRACLLKNEPASYRQAARLRASGPEPERKRVRKGVKSSAVDPKPGDLPMARVKRR